MILSFRTLISLLLLTLLSYSNDVGVKQYTSVSRLTLPGAYTNMLDSLADLLSKEPSVKDLVKFYNISQTLHIESAKIIHIVLSLVNNSSIMV
jgi:hypothetical protein